MGQKKHIDSLSPSTTTRPKNRHNIYTTIATRAVNDFLRGPVWTRCCTAMDSPYPTCMARAKSPAECTAPSHDGSSVAGERFRWPSPRLHRRNHFFWPFRGVWWCCGFGLGRPGLYDMAGNAITFVFSMRDIMNGCRLQWKPALTTVHAPPKITS